MSNDSLPEERAELEPPTGESPRQRFRDLFIAIVIFHAVLNVVLGTVIGSIPLESIVSSVAVLAVVTAQIALVAAFGSLAPVVSPVRIFGSFFLAGVVWTSLVLGGSSGMDRAQAYVLGIWIVLLWLVMLLPLRFARHVLDWRWGVGSGTRISRDQPLTIRHLLIAMVGVAVGLAVPRAVLPPAGHGNHDELGVAVSVFFFVFLGVPSLVPIGMIGWAMREPFQAAVVRGVGFAVAATFAETLVFAIVGGAELVVETFAFLAGVHGLQLLVVYSALGLLRTAGLRILEVPYHRTSHPLK